MILSKFLEQVYSKDSGNLKVQENIDGKLDVPGIYNIEFVDKGTNVLAIVLKNKKVVHNGLLEVFFQKQEGSFIRDFTNKLMKNQFAKDAFGKDEIPSFSSNNIRIKTIRKVVKKQFKILNSKVDLSLSIGSNGDVKWVNITDRSEVTNEEVELLDPTKAGMAKASSARSFELFVKNEKDLYIKELKNKSVAERFQDFTRRDDEAKDILIAIKKYLKLTKEDNIVDALKKNFSADKSPIDMMYSSNKKLVLRMNKD